MKILIFGIANVGKSTTGSIMASRLDIPFFDLDDEIKKLYGITLEEFVHTGTLWERDKKRGDLIKKIVNSQKDCVLAITPMSYPEHFIDVLAEKDVFAIELIDSIEHIFDRLIFSDENDCLYKDDEYKNQHKDYYLNDIHEDQLWYGKVYKMVKNKYDMDNRKPDEVADDIIKIYQLKEKLSWSN